MRLGRVLDHLQAVLAGDGHDPVHRRRVAVQVDRHDRPGAGRDGLGDRLRADAERLGLDVDKDGGRAGKRNRVGCRRERERRHDDLIAGADAQGQQRHVECGRARIDGDALPPGNPFRELRLEGGHLRPLGEAP